jgi:hypothetical protein
MDDERALEIGSTDYRRSIYHDESKLRFSVF